MDRSENLYSCTSAVTEGGSLTHLAGVSPSKRDQLPQMPVGSLWLSEKGLQNTEMLPGIRRLCKSAMEAIGRQPKLTPWRQNY